jgi:methionyl-tRNA formyltransferase
MTGVSIFRLSASVDTGHLALCVEAPVETRDTTPTLEDRLGRIGASAVLTVLDRIENSMLQLSPQSSDGAITARKLDRSDGLLRWDEAADVLDRRVRALVPWPCARFTARCGEVKVLRAFPIEGDHQCVPGTVLGTGVTESEGEEGVRVACGRGELLLLELQSPGKRRLPASAWLRGACLPPGSVLEEGRETGDKRT